MTVLHTPLPPVLRKEPRHATLLQTDPQKRFGEVIRKIQEKIGMDDKVLAERATLEFDTLLKIKAGSYHITITLRKRLAGAFGISLEALERAVNTGFCTLRKVKNPRVEIKDLTGGSFQPQFGAFIKKRREQRAISLQSFASEAGISVNELFYIEFGTGKLTLDTCEKIAKQFDMSLSDLLHAIKKLI